jgi:HSP20 family molecular chaperone IbpA
MDKKKTTKKIIPPVDSRSYVVDSLSKASSSIENAFNAVNSLDYASANGTVYGSSGQTWDFGHTTSSGSLNIPFGVTATTASFVNNAPNNLSLQQYIPYVDSSNTYPKIDILKNYGYFETESSKQLIVNSYTVLIYLAGVSKDRVKLTLEKGSYLGSTFYPPKLTVIISSDKSDEEKKEWFLKESKQSFTNRIVNLPPDADIFCISEAKMDNGILTFNISVNKIIESPPKVVNLTIN